MSTRKPTNLLQEKKGGGKINNNFKKGQGRVDVHKILYLSEWTFNIQ